MGISKEQYEEECNRLLSINRSQWSFEARVAYQLGLQDGRKKVSEKLKPSIDSLELDSLRLLVCELDVIERAKWGVFG